jgi:hypothetical protein
MPFSRGDHIRVWRPVPGFWHHGVHTGERSLIHYSGEIGRKVNASICRVSEENFLNGSPGEVVRHEHSLSRGEVVDRAESRLGETGYNLALNNCEHSANWCKEGDGRSEQVQRVPIAVVAMRGAATAAPAAAALVAVPVVAVLAAPVAATFVARATWKRLSRKE